MPNVPHIHAGSDANVANLNAVITAINDELQDILDGTTELTAPQISGFTNAQHAHEAASSGGKLRLASLIATASDEGKVPVPNSSGVVEWQSPAALPIASLLAFAGPETNIPANFLLCFGQSVSRSTYADLYAIIGYTFGGSGSMFNLPDLRGRFPLGLDNMGGTSANRITDPNADTLGGTGGSENVTLTVAQLASHSHDYRATRGGISPSIYTYGTSYNDVDPDPEIDDRVQINNLANANSNAANAVDFIGTSRHSSIHPNGGGDPHDNVPPYLSLNWIIRY